MKVEIKNVVIGVGVGGADELLEWQDRERVKKNPKANAPFKNLTDWGRVIILAAGYAGQVFNFMPSEAAATAQSELPLVVKSVARAVRESQKTAATTATTSSSYRPHAVSPSSQGIAWRPVAIQ